MELQLATKDDKRLWSLMPKKKPKKKCWKLELFHKVMLFPAKVGKVFPIDLLVVGKQTNKKRSGRWRSRSNKEAKNGRKKT